MAQKMYPKSKWLFIYRPSAPLLGFCALDTGSALNPRTLNPGTTVTALAGWGGLTMFRMLRGSQEKQKIHPIDISSRMVLLIRCMSASILERCWWWLSFWRAEKSSLTPLGPGLVTSVVTSAVLPQFSLFDIDGLRGLVQIKKKLQCSG